MFGVRISKIMYNYIVRIQWPKMTNIMLMRDVVLPKNFLALSIVVSRMKEEEIFLTANESKNYFTSHRWYKS